MRLKEKKSQHRRDFRGIYECEGCGATREIGGYDDRNFHDNVAPTFACEECGKSSKDLGVSIGAVPTKYRSYEVV